MRIEYLDAARPLRDRKRLVERFEQSASDANPALFLAVALGRTHSQSAYCRDFELRAATRPFAGRLMRRFTPDWAIPVADERALTDGDFEQGSGFSEAIREWARDCGVDAHLYIATWRGPNLVHRQQSHASRYYLSFPTQNDAFAWKMRWHGSLPTEREAFAWMGAVAA